MARSQDEKSVADFNAVRLAIASREDILAWSYGEVLKPETINYRTQKPERDGLFCERIFGPVKDINSNDAKLKGVRSREAAVDKNGELVTKSSARRERMGHISLATPVAHIWFMRGVPSAMSLLLNITVKNLERIAYYQSYVILAVDEETVDQFRADVEAEREAGRAAIKMRYDKAANAPEVEGDNPVDLQALGKEMDNELKELEDNYTYKKEALDKFQKGALLSENDYLNLPEGYEDLIEVGMGGEALYRLLSEIDLDQLIGDLREEAATKKSASAIKKKLQKRLKILEGIQAAGIKPESMCLTVLPVIPPDLRPMVQLTGGRFATSDLNDLYRRVINRNNRLKKLAELNAPEVITRNEMRMLQEAVDALIDNSATRGSRAAQATNRRRLKSLSDSLKGKQGRFRQNLLGKRVDYSGRSVIVSGPELTIDQCGMPKTMALELFKPFIISKLMEWEQAHNIHTAQRLIDSGDPVVWDALDEVIQGKYVLLNRAPTLHRLSIQAFQPKLIEGLAIQISPLVTSGFNADFDGDMMAVHLPLSEEAQAEARDLMSARSNLLKPADGSPVLSIYQDIVLGCYYMTYDKQSTQLKEGEKRRIFSSPAEAVMAKDAGEIKYQTPITIRFRGKTYDTTLGRVLVNEVLPEDFPFVNQTLTRSGLTQVVARVFDGYGADVAADTADKLKALALEYATRSAISTGMDDYFEVDDIDEIMSNGDAKVAQIAGQYNDGLITNGERKRLTVKVWRDVNAKVTSEVKERLQVTDSSVSVLALSGARGNVDSIKQAGAMIGVQVDATGKDIELPVKSPYKLGMTPLEAFVVTRGSRYGGVSTALKTAESGYLTRRLVDVAQDVFSVPDDQAPEDPGFTIYRDEADITGVSFAKRLDSRYAAEDVTGYVMKGDLISSDIAAAIDKDESINEVKIMSVLSTPELRGVPRKSYGLDLSTNFLVSEAEPIGVIAAQSIGELGMQLTLDTKHSGGVGGANISTGIVRVEELLEARSPSGEACLARVDLTVQSINETEDNYVINVMPDQIKVKDEATGELVAVEFGVSDIMTTPHPSASENRAKPIVTRREDGSFDITLRNDQYQPAVSAGDHVDKGDCITVGSKHLGDLFEAQGIAATERYVIDEMLKIYASQGGNVSAKHMEIIVRQMFSRVRINDPGDGSYIAGDVVSKASVMDENRELVAQGKEPATFDQLLLGITKVSVNSDSFLSGASFQDTTRVLISAAISGRVDHLKGLKENVIIGRKIPVGTGALPEPELAEERFEAEPDQQPAVA